MGRAKIYGAGGAGFLQAQFAGGRLVGEADIAIRQDAIALDDQLVTREDGIGADGGTFQRSRQNLISASWIGESRN